MTATVPPFVYILFLGIVVIFHLLVHLLNVVVVVVVVAAAVSISPFISLRCVSVPLHRHAPVFPELIVFFLFLVLQLFLINQSIIIASQSDCGSSKCLPAAIMDQAASRTAGQQQQNRQQQPVYDVINGGHYGKNNNKPFVMPVAF